MKHQHEAESIHILLYCMTYKYVETRIKVLTFIYLCNKTRLQQVSAASVPDVMANHCRMKHEQNMNCILDAGVFSHRIVPCSRVYLTCESL